MTSPAERVADTVLDLRDSVVDIAKTNAQEIIKMVLDHNLAVRKTMRLDQLITDKRLVMERVSQQNITNTYLAGAYYVENFLKELRQGVAMLNTIDILASANIDFRKIADPDIAKHLANMVTAGEFKAALEMAQKLIDEQQTREKNDDYEKEQQGRTQ